MKSLWTAAVVCLATMLICTNLQAGKDDWAEPDKLFPALEKAAKEDVPVAILYMDQDGWGWGESKFENMPGLNGFLRVKFYSGQFIDEVSRLRDEINSIWIPCLLLTDGENNLIGYVPNDGNSREWQATLSQAKAVMKWKKSSRKSMDDAEKKLETGPFNVILKSLDDIEEKDKKYTAAIRASYKATPVDHLSRRLKEPDLFPGEKERIEKQIAKATQMFFCERVQDLRKKTLESIDKIYARSEELLYGGSPKEAMDMLKPLIACKINPPMDEKVSALKDKILEAIRSGEIPKREGETTDEKADASTTGGNTTDIEAKSEPDEKKDNP
ncbi:MAG: hypothetical protein JXL80_10480 [Planctomycetes bacterium]|nr:hypothetical protein [Planctomycetota bacterium]